MFESYIDPMTDFGPDPSSPGTGTADARGNHLPRALSPPDMSLLQSRLEQVPLPIGARLVGPNTPIEHVFFLEEGIASVVATETQGRLIEAGIIGREGMTGIPSSWVWIARHTSALSRPKARACGSGLTTFGARWGPARRCRSICCG